MWKRGVFVIVAILVVVGLGQGGIELYRRVNLLEARTIEAEKRAESLAKDMERLQNDVGNRPLNSTMEERFQAVEASVAELRDKPTTIQHTQTRILKADTSTLEGRISWLENCLNKAIRIYNDHQHFIPEGNNVTNRPGNGNLLDDLIFCT